MVGYAALFLGLSLAPVLDRSALVSDLLEKEGPAAEAPKVPPFKLGMAFSPLDPGRLHPVPGKVLGRFARRPASSRPVCSQGLGLSFYKPSSPRGRAVSSAASLFSSF